MVLSIQRHIPNTNVQHIKSPAGDRNTDEAAEANSKDTQPPQDEYIMPSCWWQDREGYF